MFYETEEFKSADIDTKAKIASDALKGQTFTKINDEDGSTTIYKIQGVTVSQVFSKFLTAIATEKTIFKNDEEWKESPVNDVQTARNIYRTAANLPLDSIYGGEFSYYVLPKGSTFATTSKGIISTEKGTKVTKNFGDKVKD